jgi:predicted DNA-binding helix-hairpin-helix protein
MKKIIKNDFINYHDIVDVLISLQSDDNCKMVNKNKMLVHIKNKMKEIKKTKNLTKIERG